MKERTFQLVTALLGSAMTAAIGLITFYNPSHATEINCAIGIAYTATVDILTLFKEKTK